MPLFLYAQLVFGNLFVIRTLQLFRTRALVSTSQVTKSGTIFVCASALITFFYARDGFLCSCLLILCVFVITFALFLVERRQIDTLKNEIPIFLDRWILNLRLGSALPTAREAALRDHSESFQILIQPIFNTRANVSTKRSHLLFSAPALNELEHMQQEPHTALARLENLRSVLRKTTEFRRKSGQATRQTLIQCVVMLLLLLALTLFTLQRYGWKQTYDLILAALLLSAFGVLTMYLLARKSKWKI